MTSRQPDLSTFLFVILLARSIVCITISPVPVPGVEPELSKAFRGQAVYLSAEEAKNVRRSASPNLYSPSSSNNWNYDNHVDSYDYFPKYKPSYPGYEQSSVRDKCGGGYPSGGNSWNQGNQGSGGRWPSGSGSNWGPNTGGWNQGSGSNWNNGGGSSWNQGGGSGWNQGSDSSWNQGGGRDWSNGGTGSGWNQGGGGSSWNQGGWNGNQGSGNWGGTGGTGWHKGNQGGWNQGGGGTSGWGGWTTGSGGWSKLPPQPGSWNQGGGQWNQNSDRKWGTGWAGGSNGLDDCGYKCDSPGVVGFYGKGRRN